MSRRGRRVRVAGAGRRTPSRNHGKWWAIGATVATVVVIPLVIALVSAQYGAWVTFERAPEQEVLAQESVKRHEDAQLETEPPVVARVEQLWDVNGDGWNWVFEKALSPAEIAEAGRISAQLESADIGNGPTSQEETAAEQMSALGGRRFLSACIPDCGSATRYKVVLTGHRRETVSVVGMRARVLERLPVPDGTMLYAGTQGGEPLERVMVDLDADGAVRTFDEESQTSTPYLHSHNLTLAKDEQEGFELTAVTSRCWCKWELVVTTEYRGQQDEVVVRSDGTASGAPFETVSADAPRFGEIVDGEQRGGEFSYDYMGNWLPMEDRKSVV